MGVYLNEYANGLSPEAQGIDGIWPPVQQRWLWTKWCWFCGEIPNIFVIQGNSLVETARVDSVSGEVASGGHWARTSPPLFHIFQQIIATNYEKSIRNTGISWPCWDQSATASGCQERFFHIWRLRFKVAVRAYKYLWQSSVLERIQHMMLKNEKSQMTEMSMQNESHIWGITLSFYSRFTIRKPRSQLFS